MKFQMLLVAIVLPSAVVHAESVTNTAASKTIPISFQIENGWTFDGRIELPDPSVRRPWAVMLLGGGLGTAIDWYVPGEMTIDGKANHDADTISEALLKRGYVVMRWQAIHRDDALFAKDGFMMERVLPKQTVEQARAAMKAFREKKIVPDDHIFLLGHSLGAARATALIDEYKDAPGVVMLAGASLIPTKLDVIRKLVAKSDRETPKGDKPTPTDRHEQRVRVLGQHREAWVKSPKDSKTKLGTPWAADVLLENRTPTLLLVGSEDERWLMESYALTDHLRRSRHPDYTWHVYEGLGHQLGPEQAGDVTYGEYGVVANSRVGPIDRAVIQDAVNWIEKRTK